MQGEADARRLHEAGHVLVCCVPGDEGGGGEAGGRGWQCKNSQNSALLGCTRGLPAAHQYRFLLSRLFSSLLFRTLLDGIASLQGEAVEVERRRKAEEGV